MADKIFSTRKAIETLKIAEGMFPEMGMDYWLGKAQEGLVLL